ncbi:MAG TPA: AI-2E family transporter [Roseiflexaceae bacterium]|nr:AI-2E family transporter [Roseiflexaceae bacterium]HMP40671.1 AI-2E family transporter [Roseiflexaceae bacterium]
MSTTARPIRLSPLGKLITVTVIVALFLLLIRGLGNVIIPFVAAAITAYLFNPLITYLTRRTHVARAIWIGVLYIVAGLLVYALARYLGPLVRAQYTELVTAMPLPAEPEPVSDTPLPETAPALTAQPLD